MEEYTVQPGDTLSEILYRATGDGSRENYETVAKENGIENPDFILPGQKVTYNSSTGELTVTDSTDTTGDEGWDLESEDEDSIFGGDGGTPTPPTGGNGSTSKPSDGTTSGDDGWDLGSEDEDSIFGDDSKPSNPSGGNGSTSKPSGGNGSTSTPTKPTGGNGSTSKPTGGNGSTSTPIGGRDSKPSTPSSNVISDDKVLNFGCGSCDDVCFPSSVKGWTPLNSFKTFIVKENAGEEFVAVNQKVSACGKDIDAICDALKTIKTKMGTNCGSVTLINDITYNMGQKKQDLITKNKELIEACNQVVEYIYNNKVDKSQEAATVQSTISKISLYQG